MSEQELPEVLLPGVGDYVANQQSQAAVQQSTKAQDRVASWDSGLADLGAGTDPDFVTTLEHFEGMTHQALYQAVHGEAGMDAAGLRTLQQVWRENYSELLDLTTFNRLGLNRIFSDGLWTGAAADAAQVASERYALAANQIGQVFASVADRLDALAWSAEALRAAVQPPPGPAVLLADPDNPSQSLLPGLVNPEFSDQDRAAREVARQEAVRALNNIYKPTYPPAGSGVPTYVTVPQMAGDTPGAPGGTSPSTPGAPVTTSTTPPGTPTAPGTPGATIPPGGDTPAGLDPSQLGALEGLLPETGMTPDDPAATTPAGVTPSTTTMPGSPGLGTAAPTLDNSDQPGRTVSNPGGPGAPGASTTQPGAMATGARGAPPAGRGPMMPMAPGAAGNRRQEDDDEHTAPDYLRRVYDEWTEGLANPEGVIGADPAFEPDPSDQLPRRSSFVADEFDDFVDDFARPGAAPENTRAARFSVTPAPTSPAASPAWPSQSAPAVAESEVPPAVAARAGSSAPASNSIQSQSATTRNESSVPPAHPADPETPVQREDHGSTPVPAEAGTTSPAEHEIFTVTGSGPIMDFDTAGDDSPR
ncbi:hypothetical protein [Nocardia carnea]|uniref:PPE domain-containing protein n=1 Tax=Nocardia carnea TaxID=37328 RepID=A0ABW7TEG7_9NOCA|nr:hypothetical protein [Nocardia carnea]